jgi:hypothetical protein
MTVTFSLDPAMGMCAVRIGEQARIIPAVRIQLIVEALQKLWSCWPAPSQNQVWSAVDRYAA